jgi:hypothetical protein
MSTADELRDAQAAAELRAQCSVAPVKHGGHRRMAAPRELPGQIDLLDAIDEAETEQEVPR